MKSIFFILAVALLSLPSKSYAVDSTGCGLGSIIFRGQRGQVPQILAVTTNGTLANQTFGISSGTSGCDPNGRISGGTGLLFAFLENNMDQFALDAAQGYGETIEVVATITNKPSEEVSQILRNNFASIFSNYNVSVVDITLKVSELLA